MAIIIRTDGTKEYLTDLSLENLQKAVGGFIELVLIKVNEEICAMYINEEGKIYDLPYNRDATILYDNPYDIIVGDVVILNRTETLKDMGE